MKGKLVSLVRPEPCSSSQPGTRSGLQKWEGEVLLEGAYCPRAAPRPAPVCNLHPELGKQRVSETGGVESVPSGGGTGWGQAAENRPLPDTN